MIQESAFNAPLALGLPSNDDDIVAAKRLFNGLGRLAEPPSGFSPMFDRPLDDTVRAFQRDRGLKEDGLITPGGPTERNIQRERGAFPAEPAFDMVELDITAPIGNGLTNQPADIIGVSKALGRLGLFNFDKTRDPLPIITRRLVAGIEKFQQDNGLPVTGELKQGDKVHEALKTAAAKSVGKRASGVLPHEEDAKAKKIPANESDAFVDDDNEIQRQSDGRAKAVVSNLRPLLRRVANGNTESRIVAAQELVRKIDADPEVREALPLGPTIHAEILADLAGLPTRLSEEIAVEADALLDRIDRPRGSSDTGGPSPASPPDEILTDATGDQIAAGQQVAQRGGRRARGMPVRRSRGFPGETPARALKSREARKARERGTIRGLPRDYQVGGITENTSEHFPSSGTAWAHGFK